MAPMMAVQQPAQQQQAQPVPVLPGAAYGQMWAPSGTQQQQL
jgi:hypothetical protein